MDGFFVPMVVIIRKSSLLQAMVPTVLAFIFAASAPPSHPEGIDRGSSRFGAQRSRPNAQIRTGTATHRAPTLPLRRLDEAKCPAHAASDAP